MNHSLVTPNTQIGREIIYLCLKFQEKNIRRKKVCFAHVKELYEFILMIY